MEINFDFKCLSDDFQKYVLEKIGCKNYFEFINQYQNNFQLTISSKHITELSSIEPDTSQPVLSKKLDNVEILDKKINCDVQDSDVFKYFIKDDNLFLKTNESLSKNRKKKFKENEGTFLKKSNCWSFPLTSKTYILDNLKPSYEKFEVLDEDDKEEIKTENIQKFYFEDNKAFLIPTTEHPQYGKSIIYDKTGNMGIWSVKNKGWIFQKENS